MQQVEGEGFPLHLPGSPQEGGGGQGGCPSRGLQEARQNLLEGAGGAMQGKETRGAEGLRTQHPSSGRRERYGGSLNSAGASQDPEGLGEEQP